MKLDAETAGILVGYLSIGAVVITVALIHRRLFA